MPTLVSDVTARARIHLSDVAAEQWDDTTLIPFVVAAYEEAARVLRSKGMNLFRKESGTIAVASGTKVLNRTGGTTYPTDLLRPLEIRWRTAGATYWNTPPLRLNDGFFKDEATTASLSLYDWRNDQILLANGANVNTEVQIQYEADLPAITAGSDQILIPNATGPLGFLVASYAADSRDELQHSARWDDLAHKQLELIAVEEMTARRAIGGRWQGQ